MFATGPATAAGGGASHALDTHGQCVARANSSLILHVLVLMVKL
jgi:hypothetical protein